MTLIIVSGYNTLSEISELSCCSMYYWIAKYCSCRASCTVLRLLEVPGWNLDPETDQQLSQFSQSFQEHSDSMYRNDAITASFHII
jgi:hypothetical protein